VALMWINCQKAGRRRRFAAPGCMLRLGVRAILALAAVLFIIDTPARGHVVSADYYSETYEVGAEINEEEVVMQVHIMSKLLTNYAGDEELDLENLIWTQYDKACELIASAFAKHNPVTVDGIAVKPVVRYLDMEFTGVGARVNMTLSYGLKGMPRRVSFVWRMFVMKDEWGDGTNTSISELPLTINAFDQEAYVLFSDIEPEFTWHNPRLKPASRPAYLAREEPPVKLRVPLVSVILAIVAPLLVAAFYGLGLNRRAGWIAAALILVLAAGSRGVGVVRVNSPWRPEFKLPEQQDAQTIFEALLRNIYRSFDYTSESDVYDSLAAGVEGELLDKIYNEVYQSLVLKDQGGAVCKVQRVNIMESAMEPPDNPGGKYFRIRSVWQVLGAVRHWGHAHLRMNEYSAVYTVRFVGTGWKISDSKVLEFKRVFTDDRAVPKVVGGSGKAQ